VTFSIIARCPQSGMFGIAIASSSPAVAARCAHVRAGVGVVASQNITDPALGPALLDLLQSGLAAPDALARIAAQTPDISFRQLLVVDAQGRSAVHSGSGVLGLWGEARADGVATGGNMLATSAIPQLMLEQFAGSSGHLGDRLLGALQAGLAGGGEAGPVHSAGLKIADRLSWPLVDLRVDWAESGPIAALADL
jgi:uncharacterized Ntn-hydrolase superfamily protein